METSTSSLSSNYSMHYKDISRLIELPEIKNEEKIIVSKKFFKRKKENIKKWEEKYYDKYGHLNLGAQVALHSYIYFVQDENEVFLRIQIYDPENYEYDIKMFKVEGHENIADIKKQLDILINALIAMKGRKNLLIIEDLSKNQILEIVKKIDSNAIIYDVNPTKPWCLMQKGIRPSYYGGYTKEPLYYVKYYNCIVGIIILPLFYEDELEDNYLDTEKELFHAGIIEFDGTLMVAGLKNIADGYYIVTQISGID
jgi:hypothetical protein